MRMLCAIGALQPACRVTLLLMLAAGLAMAGRTLLVGTPTADEDPHPQPHLQPHSQPHLQSTHERHPAPAAAADESETPPRPPLQSALPKAPNLRPAELVDRVTGVEHIECLGPLHHDFGVVSVPARGIALEHVFAFRNRGSAPVAIRGVSTTCGCTVASWPSEPVQPGAVVEVPATLRLEASGRKGVSVSVAFEHGEVITRRLFAVGRMPCEVASPASSIQPDAEGRARVPLLARTDVDTQPPRTARLAVNAGEIEPLTWQPLGAGTTTRRTWSTTLSLRLHDPATQAIRIEFDGGGRVDLPVDTAGTVSPGALAQRAQPNRGIFSDVSRRDGSRPRGALPTGARPTGALPTGAPPIGASPVSAPLEGPPPPDRLLNNGASNPSAPPPPQVPPPSTPSSPAPPTSTAPPTHPAAPVPPTRPTAPADAAQVLQAQRALIRRAMTEDLLPPLPTRQAVADRCREMGLSDDSSVIVLNLIEDLRSAIERIPDDVADTPAGRRAAEATSQELAGTLVPPERERVLAETVGPVVTSVMHRLGDLERSLVESGHASLPAEEHDRFDELVRSLRRANHLRRDAGAGGFTNGVDLVKFVQEWSARRARSTPGAGGAATATPEAAPVKADHPIGSEPPRPDRVSQMVSSFDPVRGLTDAPPATAEQALRYSREMDASIQAMIDAHRLVLPRLLTSLRRGGAGSTQHDEAGRPILGAPDSELATMMAPILRARRSAREVGERHAQELAAALEAAEHAREGLELVHAWRAASAPRIFLERESPALLLDRLEATAGGADVGGGQPDDLALTQTQLDAIRSVYLEYLRERELLHRELIAALGRGLLETGFSMPIPRIESRLLREWTELRARRLALADRTIARLLDLTGAGPDSPLRTWMRAELERVRIDPESGV